MRVTLTNGHYTSSNTPNIFKKEISNFVVAFVTKKKNNKYTFFVGYY